MPEKLLIIAQAEVSRDVLDDVRKNAPKAIVLSARDGLLVSIPLLLYDDENKSTDGVIELAKWARSRATSWLWLTLEK